MEGVLRKLLEGAIDYAGLFPPAKLGMAESVEEYLEHLGGPESILAGRFICPASRLTELEAELSRQHPGVAIPISVIGTGGAEVGAFESALEADSQAMTRFDEAMSDAAPIEAFEVRAPAEGVETPIKDLEAFDSIEVYFEVPLDAALSDNLAALAEADWIGAKARTGGLEPKAFPSSDSLAGFLRECLDLDLRFKLTAGLHHPVRRLDAGIGAKMHGFLNVLAAVALGSEHDLNRAEIASILDSESPRAFVWQPESLRFGDWECGIEAAEDARELFVAWGSCSIDEPVEGLMELGLWSAEAAS